MKTLLYSSILTLSLLAPATTPIVEATTQHQLVDAKVTKLGNAEISFRIKFDAAGWQTWTQTIGENPSVLKRELERMFSSLSLSDYRLERNDMDREVVFHIHAEGFSRYLGNNIWETDIEDGGMDGATATRRKLNDTTYLVSMTQSDPQTGILMQQEITISLPDEASDLQESTTEMGAAVLRYHSSPPASPVAFSIPRVTGGGVLCLAGLGSVLSILVSGKRRKDTPEIVVLETPSEDTPQEERSA